MKEHIELLLAKVKNVLSTIFIIFYRYLEALFRLFVPPPMKSIDGEVILITGANSGIGREMCRYIVQCGKNIKLVMWDLDIGELNKFAEELLLLGGESNNGIFCYQVDISTRENIDNGYKLVKRECGDVTVIFNNAAVAPTGNFLQLTNDQINKIFQVNLMSHFWIIRNFLPDMVTKNHGRIVNICSVGALWAGPYNFPYFASKFAGHGYMEALKVELDLFKCDGIHCTTAYPVFVKTPLIGSITCDEKVSMLPRSMKMFYEADRVAKKIVDGVRREYEFIYIPFMMQVLRFLEYFGPRKLLKHILMSHAKSYSYKNKEEQKILDAPFEPHTVIINGMD